MKSLYEKPIVRNLSEVSPISFGQGCIPGSVPGPSCSPGATATGGCANGNNNTSGTGCTNGNNNAGGPGFECNQGNNNLTNLCNSGQNATMG